MIPMRNIKKAALLYSILPNNVKKDVSKYLNHAQKRLLVKSVRQISKNDIKNLRSVVREFSNHMRTASKNKLQRSKAQVSEGLEMFFLFLLFLLGGTFFLFYMFSDFVKQLVQAGFLYILIALVAFLYMWIDSKGGTLKKWYTSDNAGRSIFVGFVFSIITSTVMIIDNLLFVGKIVELSGVFFLVNVTATVIFGPIIEEIIYRGVVIDFLIRWLGRVLSVLISAVLFSLVHIPENFVDFLFVLIAGLFFGILYTIEKNLIAPTVAHSFTNIAVLVFIR